MRLRRREDDGVFSLRPASEGHTLVIPKAHYETIYDIPEDEIAYLFRNVKRVAWAGKKA